MPGRREQRYPASLAVKLDGASGTATNVSASGIYFETHAQLEEGTPIHFSLEFKDSPGGPLRLECDARIVRVERQGAKLGVGAAIEHFRFTVLEGQES